MKTNFALMQFHFYIYFFVKVILFFYRSWQRLGSTKFHTQHRVGIAFNLCFIVMSKLTILEPGREIIERRYSFYYFN